MSILNDFESKKRYQVLNDDKKQLISYWTSTDTVECQDKIILTDKLNNIDKETFNLKNKMSELETEISTISKDLDDSIDSLNTLNSKLDNIIIARSANIPVHGTTQRQTGSASLPTPSGYVLMSTKFSSYMSILTANLSAYNVSTGSLHFHYISTATVDTNLIITAFFIKNDCISVQS